jgi:hypothetical protein
MYTTEGKRLYVAEKKYFDGQCIQKKHVRKKLYIAEVLVGVLYMYMHTHRGSRGVGI